MLLLDERTEILTLVTNSLKNDLQHESPSVRNNMQDKVSWKYRSQHVVALALTSVGNLATARAEWKWTSMTGHLTIYGHTGRYGACACDWCGSSSRITHSVCAQEGSSCSDPHPQTFSRTLWGVCRRSFRPLEGPIPWRANFCHTACCYCEFFVDWFDSASLIALFL